MWSFEVLSYAVTTVSRGQPRTVVSAVLVFGQFSVRYRAATPHWNSAAAAASAAIVDVVLLCLTLFAASCRSCPPVLSNSTRALSPSPYALCRDCALFSWVVHYYCTSGSRISTTRQELWKGTTPSSAAARAGAEPNTEAVGRGRCHTVALVLRAGFGIRTLKIGLREEDKSIDRDHRGG